MSAADTCISHLSLLSAGQNPCGSTLGDDRRQAIYKLACKYDVIIVEDDPYHSLNFGPYGTESPGARVENDPKATEEDRNAEFIKNVGVSYLKSDTQGRVIRIDTFSKTVRQLRGSSGLLRSFLTRILSPSDGRLRPAAGSAGPPPTRSSRSVCFAHLKHRLSSRLDPFRFSSPVSSSSSGRWAAGFAGSAVSAASTAVGEVRSDQHRLVLLN